MDWAINLSSLSSSSSMRRVLWAIVLIVGTGGLSWSGYQDWLIASPTKAIVGQSAPASVRTSQVSISALVSAHLFGQPQQSASAEPIETTIAPETRLRLQLRGVFAHSDQTQSRALIAEQGKSAKYYRLGDSLSGDAILHAVATEHVILNRKGQLETLNFAANKSASGNRQVTARKDPSDKTNSFAEEPTADSVEKIVSTQQRTESIKDRLIRLREARDL